MKLLCAEYNVAGEVSYAVVGDNALLRNNEDFYIPTFAGRVSCVPQIVLRVGKIGKGVGERFAGRYYDEVGVGVRFYADDLEERLLNQRLSPTMAYSFDGATAISVLRRPEGMIHGLEYVFEWNGNEVYRGKVSELPLSPEALIGGMSEYYMLKIGDLIYCGNTFRQRDLKIGDHLRMWFEGACLLDFYVK